MVPDVTMIQEFHESHFLSEKKEKNMTCSTKKCRRIVGPNEIAGFFSALFESWLTGKSSRKEVLDAKVLKNN